MDLENGRIDVSDDLARVAPPPPGVRRWVDLAAQDDEQLALLRSRFDFHPLALRNCAQLDHRPKLEEYRDHLFVVTQGFACPNQAVDGIAQYELHAFLGGALLVTVHQQEIDALEEAWARVAADPRLIERGLDFVYYLVADGIVDGLFPILDTIGDEIERIEDAVLDDPKHATLGRFFDLKRRLVEMRKVLSPQRDVFALLAKRDDFRISERTSLYFRDVYDHLARLNESIEANRDLLGNALEAYLSAVSNRTNEIMKYLTIMSAVFLPLSFVVGFFGQNFESLLGVSGWMRSERLMWAMLGSCLAVPLALVAWFRRKRWV